MTTPSWLSQPCPYVNSANQATTIMVCSVEDSERWLSQQTVATRAWLKATGFSGKAGQHSLLPGEQGVDCAVVVVDEPLWSLATLVDKLPQGTYQLQLSERCDKAILPYLALGCGLAQYQFNRYKSAAVSVKHLVCDDA